jgi:hypothetical protein
MIKQTSFTVHPDLVAAQVLAYKPNGLIYSNIVKEVEGDEYGAFTFDLSNWRIKFRVAKSTPKKIGHFVTLWKRIGKGPILPHDEADPVDCFVISVRTDQHFGQFFFPRTVLLEQGILSKNGKGGKRGIRVYAPWDEPNNPQAKKTQAWQCPYFFKISPNPSENKGLFSKLERQR